MVPWSSISHGINCSVYDLEVMDLNFRAFLTQNVWFIYLNQRRNKKIFSIINLRHIFLLFVAFLRSRSVIANDCQLLLHADRRSTITEYNA